MIFREGYRLSRVFKAAAPQNVFPNNKITTSVYTKTNFLPLNIFKELTKPSNIYFLVIGILQMVDTISPTNRLPVMFIPLILILLINITRNYIEDKKRQEADTKENEQKTIRRESQGCVSNVKREEIRVSELVQIEAGMTIPADCVLVGSSEPDGSCFLETKTLDGEISLKRKEISYQFRKSEFDYEHFFKFDCIFEAENPNKNLYQFNGSLKIRGELYPFTNQNFLPRGAKIRHTSYVIGLVVYTG